MWRTFSYPNDSCTGPLWEYVQHFIICIGGTEALIIDSNVKNWTFLAFCQQISWKEVESFSACRNSEHPGRVIVTATKNMGKVRKEMLQFTNISRLQKY